VSLAAGRRLGPYEIVAPLGAGGMGEVYRARDTRLQRDVAIKILPAEFASDPNRRQRFEHEAQAAARLEHANVASVYDVGVDDGVPFIVAELVDGVSLRSHLQGQPLSIAMVRTAGSQTAEGLAAAHERGIVHRDIKPENILVCADGAIKVVDFGIAKLSDGAAGATLTVTADSTAPGMVVGTAAYMSPEQVRGELVDHRSDIFSLGAVLFEMASGKQPFAGATAAETMASVLRDEPRQADELAAITPALAAIIMRCLDKRPGQRFQSARDLAFSLQTLPRTSTAAGAVPATGPHTIRVWQGVTAGAAVAALLFATGFTLWNDRASPARPGGGGVRQLTFDSGVEAFPNLTADGSLVIYSGGTAGNRDIFLRDVGAREAINLTADSPANDWQPSLSADGQQIVFRSDRNGGGIFLIGRTGGVARRVTRSGFNPSWSPDGTRVATATESVDWRPDSRSPNQSQIQITDVVSGDTRTLPTDDAVQPSWSPGGTRIAYWGLWQRNQRDIWTIGVDGTAPARVTNDDALDWDASWSPDGRWLYFSSDRGGSMNLWRIAIDEASGETRGEPEPINQPASWTGHSRVGARGEIIYTSFQRVGNLERIPVDPVRGRFTGPPEPLTTGSNYFATPQPSRDGRSLAFTGQNGTARSVFVSAADGANIRPVTGGSSRESGINWNPSSDRIAFYSSRTGRYQIFSVNTDGSELRQETNVEGYGLGRAVWSPDARRMATMEPVTLEASIIELAPTGMVTKLNPLPKLPDGAMFGPFEWSKDDSRLLGESSKGGVVVYSLRDRSYRQITPRSTGGPRWMPDDRRIFYAIDNEFFVIDEVTGVQQSLGTPDPAAAGGRGQPNFPWSLSWDGRWLYRSRTVFESDLWLMSPR